MPSSAVKTQGDASYVEMFDNQATSTGNQGIVSATPPRQQAVVVGISNDTNTEITSGLNEGDVIVTRTITATAAASGAAARSTGSILGGATARGAGGGAFVGGR